jgi:hypothetical protein
LPFSVKRDFSSASLALARFTDSSVVSTQPDPRFSPVSTLPLCINSSCCCRLACTCLHQATKRPGLERRAGSGRASGAVRHPLRWIFRERPFPAMVILGSTLLQRKCFGARILDDESQEAFGRAKIETNQKQEPTYSPVLKGSRKTSSIWKVLLTTSPIGKNSAR